MDNLVFDQRAYSEYMDDLNNSEGFYVTPSKDGSVILGGIRPVREYSGDRYLKAEHAARFAVEEHNKKIKEGEKGFLEFLKIVNLNVEPTAGLNYYITMAVLDGGSGEMSQYQAKVWEKINTGFKVQIFRLAPYWVKSSDKLERSDFCCVGIDSLMPWMNESYLYYKCFYRIRRELLGIEVNNKKSGGSEGALWFKKCEIDDILKIYVGKIMPLTNNLYSFDFSSSSYVFI